MRSKGNMNASPPSSQPIPPTADESIRVVLPHTELALALARECVTLGCLGAISGIPGTGKTTALRTIVARHESGGGPGHAVYLRAFRGMGPTRGVRDLLEGLGVAPGLFPPCSPAQHLQRLAMHQLRQQDVRLLCVDEADGWNVDALQGFIALYDHAVAQDYPLSAVFSGSSNMVSWLKAYAAGLSRTLRCEHFNNLSPQHSISILRAWNSNVDTLASRIQSGDKEARRTLAVVMRATGGNLRRLNFFARLFRLHFPDAEPDTAKFELIESLLLKVE